MASFPELNWEKEYAKKDNPVEVRTVGIEFECRVTNPLSPFHSNRLNDYREAMEFDYNKINEKQWVKNEMKLNGYNFPIADWGYDGGDKEFVINPDSITLFNRGGSKRFKEVLDYLGSNTSPDQQSGTHIHISYLLEDDKANLKRNLIWFTMAYSEQLQKIFGRITHWAQPLVPNKVQSKLKIGLANGDDSIAEVEYPKPKRMPSEDNRRRYDCMVAFRNNTIEFRGPKASNNRIEVLAWVQFCHSMVEICSRKDIHGVKLSEALQGRFTKMYLKLIEANPRRAITRSEKLKTISNMTTFKYYRNTKDEIL